MEITKFLKTKKILLAVVACAAIIGARTFLKQEQTAKTVYPTLIETASVTRIQLMQQGFSTTSTLTALEELELIPKVSARVKYVKVKRGDRVNKGQTLVEFDASDQTAQVASSRAKVLVNQADADQTKAELENARREYERYGRLKKEGYATQQDYDTKVTSLKSAEAAYAQALASVSQARAELQLQIANLADYTLKSPINGTVMDDYDIIEGVFISSGEKAMRLANIDTLRALVDIPEESMNGIKLGMNGEVTCDSIKNCSFTGKVSMINPYVNTDTRTVRVEISVDNAAVDYILKPGMFARVLFVEKSAQNALSVPTEAIRSDGTVLVVKDNQAKIVSVKTGIVQGNDTQIVSGVNSADQVIISGGGALKDSDPITVNNN
ncbi:MAG: efflux RND transporter periplasmic adaptor subunit [Synergistaceae bacterium]|nr:efflux RND transporter periplasmic adaptor subunit [Synergistaceae bacterium]